ncbi:MAG: hypothetical protein NW226_21245 [Microscillaceae bacterium]|nr:hypothetical protein [Microscillaceae bacterium]
MKNVFYVLAFSMMSIFCVSCNQEEEITVDDEVDTQSLSDEAEIEAISDELFILSEIALDQTQGKSAKAECPSISQNIQQKSITLDFGSGCTGPYGVLEYKGKLIVTYEIESGAITPRTITTQDFSVNGNSVEGTLTASGFEESETGVYSYDLTYDLSLGFKDNSTYSQAATYNVQWLEGFGDDDYTNDLIQSTGSLTGTNRKGDDYGSTILTPLLRKTSCASENSFVTVSGIKETQPARLGTYSINYGDGACDKMVTITTPRRTYTLELP